MRRLFTIAASVALFSALALAESWTGKLIDATCMDQQKSMTACNPSSTTTSFLVAVDGKTYRLDDAGNTKAMEALKNRADRTVPNAPSSSTVSAKITGTKEGDTIKVDTIQVQ